jgi:hypothetical protein
MRPDLARAAALIALLPAAFAPPPSALCTALHAPPMIEAQMLFGLARPGDDLVPEAAWRGFVAQTITPLFPDGLTVVAAEGQWRDRRDGTIGREPSRLVMIVAPDRPDLRDRLGTIRDAYRRTFRQQSVGIVVTRGCAAF